jgi:hypothetical protein
VTAHLTKLLPAAVMTLVLFGAGPTVAQVSVQPGGGRRASSEVDLTDNGVKPDDVSRVGDWLRAMNGSNLPPAILEKIKEFRKNQKFPNPKELQEFAEKLRQENPQLQDPKQYEALRKFIEQSGGLNGLPRPPALPGSGAGGTGLGTGGLPKTPPASTQLPKIPPDAGKPDGGGGGATANVGAPPEIPMGSGGGPTGSAQTPPPPEGETGQPPAGSPPTSDERSSRQKQVQALTGWWEQNIGPLDDTPAVRQLLVELVTGQGGASGEGGIGDILDGKTASGEKTALGRVADSLGASEWKFPELGFGKMDLATPPGGGSLPTVSADPSFGGTGSIGGDSWLPVILLGVFAAVGLVLWWLWPRLGLRSAETPRPVPGLGPWPVDPRTIADREALVKAFEYLSVLQCGSGVRTWNHRSIAVGLRRAVPAAGDVAGPLADLYAVARYTPAEEPFPDPFLTDARRYVCRFGGVKPV